MEELRLDAYSPPEIAAKIAGVAKKKSGLDFFRMFVLAILAGAFIAFGAIFYTLVVHDSGLAFGLNSLVGGLVFSLGLILVVVAGAELCGLRRSLVPGRPLWSWALSTGQSTHVSF